MKNLWNIQAHSNTVNGLHLTSNGQIITTSLDHTIKFWSFTDTGNIWKRNCVQEIYCKSQILCSDLSNSLAVNTNTNHQFNESNWQAQ